MKKIYSIILILSIQLSWGQDILGQWKTIDDETKEAKSIVQIFRQVNGKYYGKIVKLLQKPQDYICETCTGERSKKKLVGMVILWNLEVDGDEWNNGRIYSPDKDAEYNCKVWFEDKEGKEIYVRGYHWTGFFRTQKWYRIPKNEEVHLSK